MSYDEGLAEVLRGDLAGEPGMTEQRMFGGLCFLRHGHMVCGLYRDGGMFRVGKANMAAALGHDGVRPMTFTGRPMGGMVEADAAAFADDALRGWLLGLGLDAARALPPKGTTPPRPRSRPKRSQPNVVKPQKAG